MFKKCIVMCTVRHIYNSLDFCKKSVSLTFCLFLLPPFKLYFRPPSLSLEISVFCLFTFTWSFYPLSLPLSWGKQLPDLLLQITIQHGKWELLPTLLSEPKWNLAGPPQPLQVQLERLPATESAQSQLKKRLESFLKATFQAVPLVGTKGKNTRSPSNPHN